LQWLSFLRPAVVAAEMGRFKFFTLCCLVVLSCSLSPCRPTVVVRGGWSTAATPPVLQSGGASRWLGRSSAAAATSSSWAPASLVLRKKCPLYLVFKHFSSELIHAGGYRSVAIFCRHGQWGGHLLIRSRVLEPSPSRSDSFPVEKRGTVAADHRR
jgi:hypothetical protein